MALKLRNTCSVGKFKQLPNKFSVGSFKQLPNTFGLGMFKQLAYGFGLSLGKFKQLPNGFGLESWEFQITVQRNWPWNLGTRLVLGSSNNCQKNCAWEVQTNALRFRVWFMGSSNNCSTVLVRVLRKSNNCTTVLVSSLGSSNSCPTLLVLRSTKKGHWFDLEFREVKTTANVLGLASWEVQTTGRWFWSLKIKKLPSTPALEEFKQLFNTLVLEMSKKQLHCFGRGSWTDQTTSHRFQFRIFGNSTNAKHLWSCLVDTTAQRFCSWILGISNKFLMVLVLSHGKFKQLLNCFGFESCEVQTTAQRFLSWILESSTNYQASLFFEKFEQLTKIFGLGKFKQLPYGFDLESWEVQTTDIRFWVRVLRSSNNCPTVLILNLGKFKQLYNGFVFGTWENQTTDQRFWILVLRSSNNYPTLLVMGFLNICPIILAVRSSNNCPTVLVLSHGEFKYLLNGFVPESWELQTTAQRFWSSLWKFKQLPTVFVFWLWEVRSSAQRFWT